jgi:hypothetical protein
MCSGGSFLMAVVSLSSVSLFLLLLLYNLLSFSSSSSSAPSPPISSLISPSLLINWTYYPPDITPRYGILMAGTRNQFHNESSAHITICIAKLYAIKHQYAFAVHQNLGVIHHRSYGRCSAHHMSPWNKIPLIQRYLTEVEVLIWIDLDGIIQRMETPLESMIPLVWNQSGCNSFRDIREYGKDIPKIDPQHLPGSAPEPFLWVTLDMNVKYSVNVNTAVIALRRTPISFQFLQRVWDAGSDPKLFHQFDPYWDQKTLCTGYWGWPWEQGGIWSVLRDPNVTEYLQGSCILPHRGRQSINSVTDQWGDGRAGPDRPFILHHPRADLRYWLVSLMIKNILPLAVVQQECHESVGKKYKEVMTEERRTPGYLR